MPPPDVLDVWEAYRSIMAERERGRASAIRKLFDVGHRDLFLILRDALDSYDGPRYPKVPRIEADDPRDGAMTVDGLRHFLASLRVSNADAGAIIRDAAERAPAGPWNDLIRPLLLGELPISAHAWNHALRFRKDAVSLSIPTFRFMRAKTSDTIPVGEWWVEFPPSQDEIAVLLDGKEPPRASSALAPSLGAVLGRLSFRMTHTPCVLIGYVSGDNLYATDLVPAADHKAGKCSHTTTARHAVLTALMTSEAMEPRSPLRLLPKRLAQMAMDREELAELARESALDGASYCVLKHPGAGWKAGETAKWRTFPISMMEGTNA